MNKLLVLRDVMLAKKNLKSVAGKMNLAITLGDEQLLTVEGGGKKDLSQCCGEGKVTVEALGDKVTMEKGKNECKIEGTCDGNPFKATFEGMEGFHRFHGNHHKGHGHHGHHGPHGGMKGFGGMNGRAMHMCCGGSKLQRIAFALDALNKLEIKELENGRSELTLAYKVEELPEAIKSKVKAHFAHMNAECCKEDQCCEDINCCDTKMPMHRCKAKLHEKLRNEVKAVEPELFTIRAIINKDKFIEEAEVLVKGKAIDANDEAKPIQVKLAMNLSDHNSVEFK